MPHTIIEHSFPIKKPQIDNLLLIINQNIAKQEGNFDITQCKARAIFCPNFIVGEGKDANNFIHITIKILEGRSLEIRKNLASNIFQIISDFAKENNLLSQSFNLSLDISEINKIIYHKAII